MESSGERGAFPRSSGACQAVWLGKCRHLALVKPAGHGAKAASCVLFLVAGMAGTSVVRAGGCCSSWAGSRYGPPCHGCPNLCCSGWRRIWAMHVLGRHKVRILVPSLAGQLSRASGIPGAPQLSLPCQWVLLRSSLPLQLTASPRIVQKRFKH